MRHSSAGGGAVEIRTLRPLRGMNSPAAPTPQSAPEDWRILRLLSVYRLLLIGALLIAYQSGYSLVIFEQTLPRLFRHTCESYALTALALLLPMAWQRPRLAIQAQVQFAIDTLAIGLLVYASGGVPNGMGILLITPAIACAIVLTPRLAIVQAAAATLAMFGEELVRQSAIGFAATEFTATGLLGLMFFATTLVANAVAVRARRSEALAARVGSDLANMSRLNENIIESMQTGVLVIDGRLRLRSFNAAAQRLLRTRLSNGAQLAVAAPALTQALGEWLAGVSHETLPLREGMIDVLPRFTRLGWGAQAPVLILLEDAAALREQAQQMKLASLGRLSAGIAHEIRNPLAAISHAGQLLAESSEISGENMRLLDMIQRHGARIEKIVRDVLDISRRDAREIETLPLKNWLIRTAGLYQEGFQQQPRPIELLDLPPELSVRFDPDHLQQVLFNLWDNSFEHASDGGHSVVMISAGRDDDSGHAWLEVRDNGSGIADDLLDHIFEPFFTTAAKGTGLGLYLSRELCEYNQARLVYVPHAVVPHGACFRILFGIDTR